MKHADLLHFIHTQEFDASLAELPMSDETLRLMQQALQSHPEAGDVIRGTGGVRKLRVGVKGRGRRGGARVLYYLLSRRRTVYLLLAYDKSETDSITEVGRNVLRQLARQLDVESE